MLFSSPRRYAVVFVAALLAVVFSAHVVLPFALPPVIARQRQFGSPRSIYKCVSIVRRFMASGDEVGSQPPNPPSPFEGDANGKPIPTTFREAEVIGLRFMQEGEHERALKGVW